MQMLMSIAIVVQIIAAIAVIILVLLQHGKGADLGAAFGSGATTSSTMVFHAPQDGHFPIQRGLVSPHCVQTYTVFNFAINFSSANFLSRSTAVAATIFFCATIAITLGSGAFNKQSQQRQGGVLGTVTTEQTTQAPAAAGSEAPAAKDDLQSNQVPR